MLLNALNHFSLGCLRDSSHDLSGWRVVALFAIAFAVGGKIHLANQRIILLSYLIGFGFVLKIEHFEVFDFSASSRLGGLHLIQMVCVYLGLAGERLLPGLLQSILVSIASLAYRVVFLFTRANFHFA